MKIAIDANASEFFKDGKYNLDYKSSKPDPTKAVNISSITALIA